MSTDLPPLPALDLKMMVPYESIRYIPVFAEPYVQQYAQAYARLALAAVPCAAVPDASTQSTYPADVSKNRDEIDTIEKLSAILRDIAIALKGPEGELQRHSWHDLAEHSREVMRELASITDRFKSALIRTGTDEEHAEIAVSGARGVIAKVTP